MGKGESVEARVEVGGVTSKSIAETSQNLFAFFLHGDLFFCMAG